MVVAIAVGALLYLGGAVAADLDRVGDSLEQFQWGILVPVCALTFLNYGLRFVKWHYLLKRLGVEMPLGENAWNFTSGLAMVISPGKAGEPKASGSKVTTPLRSFARCRPVRIGNPRYSVLCKSYK